MPTQPLRFIRRGEVVTLHQLPADRTLLEVLREDLHCTGTKEGCGEGDCGACTVVVGSPKGSTIEYRAINSCIRLAHSIDGMALWTVEDIAAKPDPGVSWLHPAQEAMVQCHGSQCGFCTPGFVMSLFALYQQHQKQQKPITRDDALHALSGNLCRCTGYRPILDAAQAMMDLPETRVNESELLSKLKLLALTPRALEAISPKISDYLAPGTLTDFLQARARFPQAQLVAGCTDVGLWVTKQHRQFAQVLDITRVQALRRVEDYPHHIAIGAAVSLTEAFAALVLDRPHLQAFAQRFAGLPVRNSGTLGGNVANGSPIGDSMPMLIALGANVVLMRWSAGNIAHREMPLEALYTGYRQNVMLPGEVLAWIKIPKATATEFSRVYKVSKRFEDDISAVCLAIAIRLEGGHIASVSVGVGGVAATPVRARKTEASLQGQPWTRQTATLAGTQLRGEFTPISDMRASAAYRSEVLGALWQRFWLESTGAATTRLEQMTGADA